MHQPRVGLFFTTWLLGAAGAVGGSIIGAAFGQRSLFIGALVGGILAIAVAVRFVEWRGWIAHRSRTRTTLGAIIGFALAAIIATQTLSSPVGPVLSSLLIGVGALVANRG